MLDYRLPHFGAGYLCLLTVAEDAPKQALLDELSNISLVKLFVLINEDVSADNSDDVLWALTQRTRQRSDLHFNDADPSRGLADMIVLDATSEDLSDWNNIRIETMDK